MTESLKPQPFTRKPCNCGKQPAPDGGRRMVAPAPERVEVRPEPAEPRA